MRMSLILDYDIVSITFFHCRNTNEQIYLFDFSLKLNHIIIQDYSISKWKYCIQQ